VVDYTVDDNVNLLARLHFQSSLMSIKAGSDKNKKSAYSAGFAVGYFNTDYISRHKV